MTICLLMKVDKAVEKEGNRKMGMKRLPELIRDRKTD